MSVMRTLLGELSWTPPEWARRLGPARLFGLVLLTAALVVMGIAVFKYMDSLPVPPRVTATAVAPGISPVVNNQPQPQALLLNFEITTDPRQPVDSSQAIARMDLIQSPLGEGISISPAADGEWQWVSDTQMRFTPAEDWPAGQRYVVTYSPDLFAPGLEFDGFTTEFTTLPFTADIQELKFYQDPVDSEERKVVATLSFSHPVDQATLAAAVSLGLRKDGQTVNDNPMPLPLDVRREPSGRVAYVHSSRLAVPPRETFATLSVDGRLKPLQGESNLDATLTQTVRIPDVSTYFKVDQQQFVLVPDENGDPRQTLTLTFTDRVSSTALDKKLTLYRLPGSVNINGQATRKPRWNSAREVTPDILSQAQVVPFTLNPVESGSANLHSARLDVPVGAYYYVRIDQGLKSNGEFVLSTPYENLFYASPYPEEVEIAQDGAILPLSGSHQLHFVSRGVEALKVEIGRLRDRDVNHLASQIDGDMGDPRFSNWRFNQDNLQEREDRYITLPSADPRRASYAHLDMSEFLSRGGYYFVRVSGWNAQQGYEVGGSDQRIVLITDLGLVAKVGADGEQDLFVHSLATGNPVARANIELLGKNGLPVLSATTDEDGHARMSAANAFVREKTATVYVVRKGDDSVFMPYGRYTRQVNYSRFDTGGEFGDVDGNALRAQLFTERDLYRPGDVVHMGAIVKRGNWRQLDRLPLRWLVRDARGQLILDRPLRLPADGFIEQRLQTDPASSTGAYEMALYTVEGKNRRRYLGGHTFKVEEFQPDRLRISSTITGQKPKGWLKPDNLGVEIQLDNLFGTPAAQRRVLGSARLQAARITFNDYPKHVFTDPLRQDNAAFQTLERELTPTQTNDEGQALLPLNLGRYEGGIYQLDVYTEGFEAGGGRSVKARSRVMVSPLDYLVGYTATGDLDFIKKEADRNIHFIALDSNAEPYSTKSLSLQIIERRFVSSLVKQNDGTFAYQSISQDSVLSESDFALPTEGAAFALPTARAGRFAVQLVDTQGMVYSRVPFVVAGERNVAGNLEQNAELDLTLNKRSFAPGERIEIQITAPYTGTGLITIERDRVLAYRWFNASTNSSTQTIEVPENLEGNAYVNVTFMRSLDSKEIYLSPLSYAVEPFSIKRDARTIDVALDVPDVVVPGTGLTINYRTNRPGKILVFAVDEGILQVANYARPKPLDFFLRKRALRVNTFQMADLVLPEFVASNLAAAPGGGEAASLAGKNLNPFRRNSEAPVVFWSGILPADTTAQSVEYAVPDYFSGQLTIMAVAVADGAVGDARSDTLVKGPFVISPNVPVSVAPGDEFDVAVSVANNVEGSGADAVVQVSAIVSEQLTIVGPATRTLSIDEGREDRALFRIKATDTSGPASIQFDTQSGSTQATRSATLSVRPATPYRTTLSAEAHDRAPVTLDVSRRLREELADTEISASNDPIILASGLQTYLDGFPHACAEQMVSKVFPQIGLYGRDERVDDSAVRTQFNALIDKLRARQLPNGAFRFWPSSSSAAEFPSVYITHFLTEAQEANLPVSQDMLRSALTYLRELAARNSSSSDEARLRAYAIYILTRNGTVTTNYLTSLQESLDASSLEWRQDITAVYMAASYALLKLDDLASSLIAGYTLLGGNEMFSDFDTRLGRDAQYLFLLAKHFPESLDTVKASELQRLVTPVFENRFNTLSSAYTVLALQAYGAANDRAGKAAITLTDAEGNVLAPAAVIARASVQHDRREVRVDGDGSATMTTLFTTLAQTGFDAERPHTALSEGLEIDRRFLNADGTAIDTSVLGDELTVRLRVRSTGRPRTNVAVVDLLPGGFEILAESLRDQQPGGIDYLDIREDRLVVYGTFSDSYTELNYRVKATTSGTFTVPAAYANSMYDLGVNAHSPGGQFTVSRPAP